MHCIHCGKEIPDEAEFCSTCGKPVVTTGAAPKADEAPKKTEGGKDRSGRWAILGAVVVLFLVWVSVRQKESTEQSGDSGGYASTRDSGPPTRQEAVSPRETRSWYEGGTLHRATVSEWRTSTGRNRLATSADFASAALNHKGRTFDSTGEMLGAAIAMKTCIDAATPDAKEQMPVTGIAAICALLLD